MLTAEHAAACFYRECEFRLAEHAAACSAIAGVYNLLTGSGKAPLFRHKYNKHHSLNDQRHQIPGISITFVSIQF